MDFRDLNYVLAIAKYQNITKAAEKLYVGQPALSKFLKNIESDLGQPLFRKLGNKYILTYAGERYVERANQIMGIKTDLEQELSDIIKRDVGVLKVAVPTMRSSYMLPSTLIPFREMHPNIKVEVVEGHSSDLDQKILTGEADMAFYTQPAREINPLIGFEVISKEELLLCTHKNHRIQALAKKSPHSRHPKINLKYLEDELVIMMREEQRTRQIVDTFLRESKIQFKNVFYTSNIPALIELVATGYGVSFIFEPHLHHRISSVPIDCYSFGKTCASSNFVVAYRRGSYMPSYAKDFIDLVRQVQQVAIDNK